MEKFWNLRAFWRQRIVRPLVGVLRMGVSAEEVARALALGATIGLLPAVGTTTVLCLLIGGLMRLNQVATQLSNYAITPLQIALILPYLRLGETLLGVDNRFPLDAATLRQRVDEMGIAFTLDLGRSLVHALVGWASVAPFVFLAVYLGTRPALNWLAASRRRRWQSGAGEASNSGR